VGNYLKMPDRQRVLALRELGWSYRRIERETGVRRETAARYDRMRQSKPANLTTGPVSVTEPYRAVVEEKVRRGLTAQRIWQDLCEEHGFAHSYETVKLFVRKVKRRRPEVADVMEHLPGDEAQVDYFKSPAPVLNPQTGKWGRPWVFRMTLSCSRHGYEEPMWRQEAHGFLRAHEHAFLAFGGVPKVVRHDNLKAAVVRACLYDPDVNVLYESFAKHWGFVPLPSRPRHPEENGIEERSGGYVKSNALKGHHFDSLEEMAAHLQKWNSNIAQRRIHGTTRKQVITHFLEVERPLLQPLPGERFAMFEVGTRTVHADGHVEVKGAFYSVPHTLVAKRVRVHWNEHLVRVYDGATLVAVHSRKEVATWSTRAEHRPAHKPARTEAYEQYLLQRCERIGSRALAWATEAVVQRDVRSYRLLQGVVALTRSHPRERVDWACGLALQSRSFRYRTVRRLVEQAVADAGAVVPLTQQHELIRPLESYGSLA